MGGLAEACYTTLPKPTGILHARAHLTSPAAHAAANKPTTLAVTTRGLQEATAAALSSAPLAEPAWSMRMVPVAQFYEEPSGEIERIMQNRYGRDFEYATTPANHDAPELSKR